MTKIKENIIFFITIFFILFLLLASIFLYLNSEKLKVEKDNLRIISLSPSITEFIYDIGLNKYLVANTTFCNYPDDAKNKLKIGTFSDVNYEYIASLKINTVILESHMEKQKETFEKMGYKVIVVKNNTINDILNTYDTLGKAFNMEDITNKKKQNIIDKINNIKSNIKINNKNISAVISIYRDYLSNVKSLTVAGGNNIYNDILEILNINNPFNKYAPYTNISVEALIKSNPDIIFDMYHGKNSQNIEKQWELLPIKAVNNNHIIVLSDTYLTLPGPRIYLILEEFAKQVQKVMIND